MTPNTFTRLLDRELLEAIVRVAADERRVTAELLALLGEIDARRLYLAEGYSSLFTYCTRALHLSEHAAYHRIEAARAARQFPVILDRIAEGALTLTTVALLRPHLTPANQDALLIAARHKSKRDVEHQIAELAPRPDAKPLIRRVSAATTLSLASPLDAANPTVAPTRATVAPPAAEPLLSTESRPRPVVAPLAPERYLRHTLPNGDPASILDKALTLLIEHLEKTKIATVSRPRRPAKSAARHTRHIPAAVRRAVWARDEGRCAFVGPHGRCAETGGLEFHHLVPFADGGPTGLANLALRCRAHKPARRRETGLGPDRAEAIASRDCRRGPATRPVPHLSCRESADSDRRDARQFEAVPKCEFAEAGRWGPASERASRGAGVPDDQETKRRVRGRRP